MKSENKLTMKNYEDFLTMLRKQILESSDNSLTITDYMEGFAAGIEAARTGLEIYFG